MGEGNVDEVFVLLAGNEDVRAPELEAGLDDIVPVPPVIELLEASLLVGALKLKPPLKPEFFPEESLTIPNENGVLVDDGPEVFVDKEGGPNVNPFEPIPEASPLLSDALFSFFAPSPKVGEVLATPNENGVLVDEGFEVVVDEGGTPNIKPLALVLEVSLLSDDELLYFFTFS